MSLLSASNISFTLHSLAMSHFDTIQQLTNSMKKVSDSSSSYKPDN